MRFEVVNKKGDLIHFFELDSNPFTVGEVLHIKVSNHDKKFWKDTKEFMGTFDIEKIEHYYNETFSSQMKYRGNLSISLTVFEIDYVEL